MAASSMQSNLSVCSFNMYGFNNGLSMSKILCSDHDIVFIQEHWLSDCNMDKLDSIHPDFQSFGLSSMNIAQSNSILNGRPFGGVVVLWRKNLSKYSICISWTVTKLMVNSSQLNFIIIHVTFYLQMCIFHVLKIQMNM